MRPSRRDWRSAATSPTRTELRSGRRTARIRKDSCASNRGRAYRRANAIRRPGWLQRRCSSQHPEQVDKGEDADPDDVEEMPEHAETHQPAFVRNDEAMLADLHQHDEDPDDAGRDVQAMHANQREESGQEAAALRGRAFSDQAAKLVKFD